MQPTIVKELLTSQQLAYIVVNTAFKCRFRNINFHRSIFNVSELQSSKRRLEIFRFYDSRTNNHTQRFVYIRLINQHRTCAQVWHFYL